MSFYLTLTLISIIIYLYLKYYVYNYWKRNKIPHKKATIPLGNLNISFLLGKTTLGNLFKEFYDQFKHLSFHGFYMFNRPILFVTDPELIKMILVKDFWKFSNRGWYGEKNIDFLTDILFLQPVERWKKARQLLTPAFTPGKLKQIHPLMKEIGDEMVEIINKTLVTSNGVLDFKDILCRYTTDIISSAVYGFNCKSLSNRESEFHQLGMKSLTFKRFNMLISAFFPEVLEKISLAFFDKELRDFFWNVFKDTVEYCQKHKIIRKDFMNLLIQLIENGQVYDEEVAINDKNDEQGKLSMREAAGQAFNLFSAGSETSSTTAACLIELAINLDIQRKLQDEIDKVAKSADGFTFDNIMNMEYLDMIFSETMRKHAPVSFLNRVCMEDYRIPDSNFVIPKRIRILTSPPGLHRDPDLYPDPEKFDPLRFSKDKSENRNAYSYLAFSEGPRNCIGKRFGIIQTKQALISLLYNFEFKICDKTILPIKYNTESLVQLPTNSIFLRVEKRR